MTPLRKSIVVVAFTIGCAAAADISGRITQTLIFYEDSQLTGDVTCAVSGGACLEFGASNISLKLNGFSITGPANPPANCVTTTVFLPEDGITGNMQNGVQVIGPGLVQKFRRHGIFFRNAARALVRHVTSADNCFSGLQLNVMTDSDIEEIVSVRNAIASAAFPCGGNCITNSNGNRIRRNLFAGNGSIGPPSDDFGVGLVGTSSDNLIEYNHVAGNTNGLLIQMGSRNNVIRGNVLAGNPPIQVSATAGAAIGTDISNLAPAGTNTFDQNLCLTYTGAGPPPCPNIPKF